jgi:hypothetical protein
LPNNFEAVDFEHGDSSANHEQKLPVSCRNSAPACDFYDNNRSLTLCLSACVPSRLSLWSINPHLEQRAIESFFTQFHQAPARDRKLLACVFDDKRRTQTVLGVKVLSKGNSKPCRKMDAVVNALGFQDRLKAAVNKPDSKDAFQLLKTLHNCLTIAGKDQRSKSRFS